MAVVSLEKGHPPDMEEVPEFQEEFAEISETYNSFPKDFEGFKSVLEAKLPGYPNGTFPISGLGGGVIYPVYKVKRFRCECIKHKGNKSGIRIIYAYNPDENKILFLELYHKSQKPNNDEDRIYKYLSGA